VIRTCFSSKKRILILFSVLTLIVVILAAFTGAFLATRQDRFVVIRVDDIQDFAFRDAQLFLLKQSAETNVPLSLAIIAGMFGEDTEILEAVQLAVASGCEVGAHGWKHENLTNLSMTEQMNVLFQAKMRIKDLLGIDTQLLIPPMFSFNADTISAMHYESYSILSTCTDFHEPSVISGITNVPATVELSTLVNDVWQMKNVAVINAEVEKSVELYGYAAIVTHPQEFVSNGQINQAASESYINLLTELGEAYKFTTFENLKLQNLQS
jgi:peptidoglycan/xylan/chitin deacetylase (PgdA/CDA1 family)